MVSKHYYMGSQRVASSMADVPSQIANPPASGGGEGVEEFASANLSSPDDPVIIDFISTMNCVYNASIDLAFDESLSMPELDQINFHNCEGEEFPPEELAQEDRMCLCEQSVYWGNIYGADCSSRNVMYWYHPDYLGSVEAITDVRGEVYQFFHNTIWGEPLQDQKAFTYKDFSSRFRFNGKERDEETGNYYYGARYYDPKISVWLSVDPLAHMYPYLSSYTFVANNPLMLVDLDGRHIDIVGEDGTKTPYTPGMQAKGDEFTRKAINAYNKAYYGSDKAKELINGLVGSDKNYNVNESNGKSYYRASGGLESEFGSSDMFYEKDAGGDIYWNPSGEKVPVQANDYTILSSKGEASGLMGLLHETAHAFDQFSGNLPTGDSKLDGIKISEWQATHNENIMRSQLGFRLRTHFGYNAKGDQGFGTPLLLRENGKIISSFLKNTKNQTFTY